mgnify:CR=1 FL=1
MTVVYISDIETLVKAKMEIDELQIKNEEVEEKSKIFAKTFQCYYKLLSEAI